jgi:hypothetical protein
MGQFSGTMELNNSDIQKDMLTLKGDKETLAIILTLIDPNLVVAPKLGNTKSLLRAIKNGVRTIVISIGDSEIPKEVLIESLKFCKVV